MAVKPLTPGAARLAAIAPDRYRDDPSDDPAKEEHMTSAAAGILDESYHRLHATGPEFDGWLSNHGPMAAEAMVRRGQGDSVRRWLDGYLRRLEEFPRGMGPIGANWRDALGDPRRVADWTTYFQHQLDGQPWREVLITWWPRLLPGLAAAATHGVIRTGHAVRALLADGEDPEYQAELAHSLAYWAARWQPVPGAGTKPRPAPRHAARLTPAAALAAVPKIADQSGGIHERLSRLPGLAGWQAALAGAPIPDSPDQARTWLAGLADAATTRYLEYGHGNAVMLVHSATAPTAALRTLAALPERLWAPTAAAAWAAAAALTAIYAPASPAPPALLPRAPAGPLPAEDAFARAVDHGDEHVIKFADTAADVHARTGSETALAAIIRAAELIPQSPR